MTEEYLNNIDIFKKVLTFNLNVSNEKVLIVGDNGINGNKISPVLCDGFQRAAEELGINYEVVKQAATLHGENAEQNVVKKLKQLPKESVIIMNMSHRLGKLANLGLSFRKYCNAQGHRFTSASSLGLISNKNIPDIINAYDIDYEALSEKAHKIKKIWDKASEINVTTPAGTDITFSIENMKARVADGLYRKPGTGGNLPGTEVYIAPEKDIVNGKIVIDGSMRNRHGTKLVKKPFSMEVKQGNVTEMSPNPYAEELEETLTWAYNKAKHPWGIRRIAEFGLGLNPKAKVLGCTVVDEKTLGTGHFAIGSNYWFGGTIYAIIHLDQVFWKPKIRVDDKLMKV